MNNVVYYITYIVSTLFTYAMGIISKRHKWNETLPIPIQNIAIGLLVFIITYVFCLVSKIEVTNEDMLQQIISAMGGVGTATLGYDTQKIGKED